jgi:hypothetical protein
LFVWEEHNKIGAKHDSAGLFLIIIDLNGRVERTSIADNLERVSLGTKISFQNKFFDFFGEGHFPEFFVGFEHVDFTDDTSNETGSEISYVDTLVFIESNSVTGLNDFGFHRWDIISRSFNHPFVSGLSDNSLLDIVRFI